MDWASFIRGKDWLEVNLGAMYTTAAEKQAYIDDKVSQGWTFNGYLSSPTPYDQIESKYPGTTNTTQPPIDPTIPGGVGVGCSTMIISLVIMILGGLLLWI